MVLRRKLNFKGSPESWLYSVTFANTAMMSLPTIQALLRATGVLLMVTLLALLTSLNFLLYCGKANDTTLQSQKAVSAEEASAPGVLPNPTGFPDEKAPDDTGSFSEDYLHTSSVQHLTSYSHTFMYPFQPEAKLTEPFGGQFTPPPEC